MRTWNQIAAITAMAAAAGAAAAAEPVRRAAATIDWQAAREAPRATLAAPAGIRLPVLVLPAQGDWGTARLVGQGAAYAALYAPPRAKLGVFGSATHLAAPAGIRIEHAPADPAGTFESIGDGADYSFTRYGAYYTLRITCDEPLKDARCTAPDYLAQAARGLLVAGGAP